MKMYVVVTKDKKSIFAISPITGPDFVPVDQLQESVVRDDDAPLIDYVMESAYLPQLFPYADWAEAIFSLYPNMELAVVEMTASDLYSESHVS